MGLSVRPRVKKLLAISAGFLFAHLTASPAIASCTDTSFGCIPHDAVGVVLRVALELARDTAATLG